MSDSSAFLKRIHRCIASARQAITVSQSDQQSAADDLRDLVAQITDAFVELAHHYLPRLDHQALENSWVEVRHRVHHHLLLRDDQARQLRDQLREASSMRSTLQNELDALCDQMERAQRDLMSKTGNAKKVLRLDPSIKACSEAIQRVDQEIDRGMAQLEFAESDARRKLPDYETSSLFSYLNDRQYGTPHYNENGIERRWDRWVAKLIDYEKLKSSFEYLKDAPNHLTELINQKRDQYKSLLIQLETAQNHVIKQFGMDQQERLLARIDGSIQSLRPRVDEARQRESKVQAELVNLDSLDGEYYQQAIKDYEAFLRQLNPEILSVYAACTDSPIDDEICARLRNIRETMDRIQLTSAKRAKHVANQERFVVVLHEVASLMRAYQRLTDASLTLNDQFCFDDWVSSVQIESEKQQPSTRHAWRQVRSAIQRSAPSPTMDNLVTPVEAAFLAASNPHSDFDEMGDEIPQKPHRQSAFDGIDNTAPGNEFRLLVQCDYHADAAYMTSLLDGASIPWFIHDGWTPGNASASEFSVDSSTDVSDQIHIMVFARHFNQAEDLIKEEDQK